MRKAAAQPEATEIMRGTMYLRRAQPGGMANGMCEHKQDRTVTAVTFLHMLFSNFSDTLSNIAIREYAL